MISFTNNYGKPISIEANKIRSIRSYTYGLGQTTVTRIEYVGGDTESVTENVVEVESRLRGAGLSFIYIHDVYNNEHRVVRSHVRSVKPFTYGLSSTTVSQIEYDDGDNVN